MILDIKQNINKIDNDLKDLFENVYIAEKADKGNFYVTITANKMFLFEGCKKRVEVKVDINKTDLNNNTIKWIYSLNPLNENAGKIERISYLHSIAKDIYDIAANKRMVNEYFSSLESHVDLILEDVSTEEEGANELLTITNIVKEYVKLPIEKVSANIQTEGGWIEYTTEIDMANKFRLEKKLLESGLVSYVSFNDDIIKVTL
jgi:hypothetical protein